MALKPAPGYAVLKRVEKEATTASGLIIQSNSAKDPSRAIVVVINVPDDLSKLTPEPFIAKEGDEIIVKNGSGQLAKDGGQDVVIVGIGDIIAVVG